MWPRVGGHVGPPTPLTPEVDRFELMPWRSSPPLDEVRTGNALTHVLPSRNPTQSSSPPYLGSSCVLTSYIFTLSPPFTCPLLQYQQPLQMPLEPRNSPRRPYQRMYRRIQHPYRLLTLSERMHRYRPILPSLQEEESPDQRSNIEVQERPSRTVMKRQSRIYSPYQPSLQIQENPPAMRHPNETPGFHRIPPNDWLRRTRQSHWEQPDEPEIIITSDVQLQTDDNETGFDSSNLSILRQASSTDISESSPNNYESTSTQTDITGTVPNDNIPELVGAYIDVETETNPPNNTVENYVIQNVERAQSDMTESYSSPNNKETVSTNQAAFNKSLKMLTSASMVPFKLPPRSMPVMPTATYKARQVANSVIKHARKNKTLNVKALHCLNCELFPILPVTGPCGHTRCTKCIENNGDCPCGGQAPKDLHVNTVVQYLIGKMLQSDLPRRGTSNTDRHSKFHDETMIASLQAKTEMSMDKGMMRLRGPRRLSRGLSVKLRRSGPDVNARMPMSPQVQFEYARRLLAVGRYRDAAPHFARVAATSAPRARIARSILAQIIMILAESCDPRRVTRDLLRSVRLQAAGSWLKPGDLECVLCYHSYTRPVTTPCGHTYCRTCIERALDYRKACALCLRPLDDFDLTAARETEFVSAALESIDASQPQQPPEPDVIPIFVCTVAYPSIPCPLFIFDPRYWLMIRRVLESGSRKFGMVAYERDRNYSDYGTILEVCDCVHLEDGRSFLSTVGVSRFRVIERDVRDGCDVARIQPLTDITPTEEVVILDMRCLGSQILYKALMWLNGMNKTVRTEIETAFGEIPRFDDENDGWWDSPDGPAWLWWLIAILPLRSEIKVLILSTKNLMKRMMAVSRTLEAIDQVAITTTATSECEIRSALTNAEEWLERGS